MRSDLMGMVGLLISVLPYVRLMVHYSITTLTMSLAIGVSSSFINSPTQDTGTFRPSSNSA